MGWREMESTIRPVICAFNRVRAISDSKSNSNFLMASRSGKRQRCAEILMKSWTKRMKCELGSAQFGQLQNYFKNYADLRAPFDYEYIPPLLTASDRSALLGRVKRPGQLRNPGICVPDGREGHHYGG